MKTLYASDLDGTLLDAQARLSNTTIRILNDLMGRGVDVTFITARTPATVQPIMQPALPRIPGVVMTGAGLWCPSERRYAAIAYQSAADVARVLDISRAEGVFPFIYTLPKGSNTLVVYHEAPTLTAVEHTFVVDRTLNELKTFHLNSPLPSEANDIVVLFFAMGQPADIERVARRIREATDCYASCYPDTYNQGIALLEVFTHGVSKAEGLHKLKALTQADRVIAFGDNLNDIPMLQAADLAVAVENAHPQVKAIADIVIGPNTSDSVAKFILDWSQKS